MFLKILGIDSKAKRGEFSRKLIRPYYAIHYFSTPFQYLRDGKFETGKKGDILINTPNYLIYHGPLNSAQSYIDDWIYIQGDDFEELLEKYPLPLNEAFGISEHNNFHKHAIRLYKEWRLRNKVGAEDMIDSIITEMIVSTYRSYKKDISSNERQDGIAAVRQKIIENPTKNWTLKEMATLSGYSTSRFSELYCNRYNCSPKKDIINQRIMLAKELLISGELSVSNVADACGFKSIHYFSRYFKKATGYTPSEYMLL